VLHHTESKYRCIVALEKEALVQGMVNRKKGNPLLISNYLL
jgi:hypothetical protein